LDYIRPFQVTPCQASEIRQVAKLLLWGDDPTSQPETEGLYYKWKWFFDVFLVSVDRRTGSLLHLPFSGGLFEQPSKTMSVLTTIQSVFFEKLQEDLKVK
jgi:hypothetical protein